MSRSSTATLAIVVAFATACGRIGFDERAPGDGTVGEADAPLDAATVCASWSPFSVPQPVTELNSSSTDWAPSISSDGLVLTFASTRSGDEEMYRATRTAVGQPWSTSMITELVNPGTQEDDPTVSSDGLEIYYGKTRLYVARRASTAVPFGPRSVLLDEDSGFTSLQGAELTRDDLTLYFNALAPSLNKIFVMQRATKQDDFTTYTAIADPDPGGDTGYSTLSSDELEIWFSSDHGSARDIWHASRASRTASFGSATLVTELNTSSDEWDPEISADGTTIWFSSPRISGNQDLYVATRTCLSP